MATLTRFRTLRLEPLETRQLTAVDLAGLTSLGSFATYSIDGLGNNLQQGQWGSINQQLSRLANAQYSDGISTPNGTNRPSPRVISNTLATQTEVATTNRGKLSSFAYAWGQFIDHDLGLTPTGTTESFSIAIPKGDTYFDPLGTGTKTMAFTRSTAASSTGTSTTNPRQQLNSLTAWLDGSVIYGTDSTTAMALRTGVGGKLKIASDGMLPLNNAANFPNGTVPMINGNPALKSEQMYAAGEIRANENIELTSLQTIFVREHNRWAATISGRNPKLTDQDIYIRARAIVIGEIQAITYNEWLPALLGPNAIRQYQGYNAKINPQLSNEFATAAFRFGHSLLGEDVGFLDSAGKPIAAEVPLSQALFNPVLLQKYGLEPVLKYLSSDPASELDTQVADAVRNFLFGPPGSGGLDLVSLNIQRGRDHGLASYNSVRVAIGLPRIQDFTDITRDSSLQGRLRDLYGTVDNIDLWVAILAEDHVPGGNMGITGTRILANQFERIRDGDRFWYQNVFSGTLLRDIQTTRLSDIIMRNSNLKNIQSNVFIFNPSIEGVAFLDRNQDGRRSPQELAAAAWTVSLVDSSGKEIASTITDREGRFRFDAEKGLLTGTYSIRLSKDPRGKVITGGPVLSAAITRGDSVVRELNLAVPPSLNTPATALNVNALAADQFFNQFNQIGKR